MNLNEWHGLIKECRGLLKSKDEWAALAESTRKDYKQKAAALNGRLPSQAATCKRTYYAQRAAYLHMETQKIRTALNTLDKWTKANGGGQLVGHQPAAYFDQVRALDLDHLIDNFRTVATAGPFSGARRGVDQSTHGKRAVGRLPKNWKTKLLGGVPKTSKYRAHVAVMALCGCRPSEFENSVMVEKIDDDTYRFTIGGMKTGERTKNGKTYTTGQAMRELTISRVSDLDKHGQVNPEFIILEKALAGKKYAELTAKATAIRDVVIHASEKAFPDLKNRPTAYSFRHAFASELKASNSEHSEQTAAALGHACTKTQQGYGYSKSGRGGFTCKAKATAEIRKTHTVRNSAKVKPLTNVTNCATPMPAPNKPKAPMPPVPRAFQIPKAFKTPTPKS
jgi:integrase